MRSRVTLSIRDLNFLHIEVGAELLIHYANSKFVIAVMFLIFAFVQINVPESGDMDSFGPAASDFCDKKISPDERNDDEKKSHFEMIKFIFPFS